jgi:ABC-type multidrug transport system ATPase subunit
MPALSIRSLRKSFLFGHRHSVQRRAALRGVDLDVEGGEIIGIVGDSGCGKTTLLLCAAGLLRPDAGSIHWYGKHFAGGGRVPDLVYVPAVPTYYPFLTVRDVLSRHNRRESDHLSFAHAIREVSDRVSLAGRLTTSVSALAISELKLLAIAQAIMEKPKIIVLDGTLDALDEGASIIKQAIDDEATHATTLILASRYASVVSRAATRIVVMDGGRVTASFSAESAAATQAAAFTDIGTRVRQIAERVH